MCNLTWDGVLTDDDKVEVEIQQVNGCLGEKKKMYYYNVFFIFVAISTLPFFSFPTTFKFAHFIVLAIETGILLDLNRAYVINERSLNNRHVCLFS